MRDKAWRRAQANKKQRKRQDKWERSGWNNDKPGKFRDNHFGCGCHMCKPWKHGIEPELRPSERRKCQNLQISDQISETLQENSVNCEKKSESK